MLNNLPNGTFLIRVSNTAPRRGEHALSIRSDLLFFFHLVLCSLLISAPSLGVYYCQQLTVCLSVCLSVTLLQIASSFFCFLMELSHFLAVISPCAPLQNVLLRFLI